MKRTNSIVLTAILGLAVIMNQCSTAPSGEQTTEKLSATGPSTDEVMYVPPDSNIFEGPGVIQKWVDAFDDASIEAHAWELWGGISALTNQMYPSADTAKKYNIPQVPLAVMSTWWSELEIFNPVPEDTPAGPRNIQPFHGPRQVSATPGQAAPEAHGGDVLSFNKYSQEFKDYVSENKFYTLKALCDLKKANAAAIPQTFDPKKSMMLKPTFVFASSTEPVLLPYWKGPGMTVAGTTNPDVPVSSTWTQWVLFNPTTKDIPAGTPFKTTYTDANGNQRDTTLTQYEIVGLKDFYWLPLTPADIKYIQTPFNIFTIGGISPKDLKVGDLSLMIACHVTSIEFFEDWTWQTFWWSPHPAKTPPASANVKGPFAHYDLMPSYYMIGKDKQPFISQNPYLEPSITSPIVRFDKFSKGLGVRSNCMSCHHSAGFPTANMDPNPAQMLIGSYLGAGQIDANNPIFGPMNNRRVNTNFMWSIILLNQGRSTPDGKDSLSIYLNSTN